MSLYTADLPNVFTLLSSTALQIFNVDCKRVQKVDIPPGYLAIVPGYTLERATCGLIQAAVHQVVSLSMTATSLLPCLQSQISTFHVYQVLTSTAPRTSLAFKLRATPSAVLSLYSQLPSCVKPHVEPR